jgi:hypothetical protein
MEEKKEDIEIRFILRPDKDEEVYDDFVKARDYFKIRENEVGKMLLIKGIEYWFKKHVKYKE